MTGVTKKKKKKKGDKVIFLSVSSANPSSIPVAVEFFITPAGLFYSDAAVLCEGPTFCVMFHRLGLCCCGGSLIKTIEIHSESLPDFRSRQDSVWLERDGVGF